MSLPRATWPALILGPVLLLAACGGGQLDEHLQRGEDFMAEGSFEEAHLEGIYVLQRRSEDPEALWLVSRALLALERDAEAVGYCRSLVQLAPERAREAAGLFHEMAVQDYESRRGSRAARRWRSALEFDPRLDLGPYAFDMGGRYYREGDPAMSVHLYEQALAAYPDSSAAEAILYPFATSLARVERFEDSARILERLLERSPKHPDRAEAIFLYQDNLIRLARAEREALDPRAALARLDKVLRYRANPAKRDEAQLEKGLCLEDLGDYRSARRAYQRLVEQHGSGTGRSFETALQRLEKLEKAGLR